MPTPSELAAVTPIANEGGSAGKTTTAVELAANAAAAGAKVLLCDADAQHNASHILGIIDPKWTIGDVLLRRCDIRDGIVESNTPGIWVLPSADSLKGDKFELGRVALGAEQRLRQALEPLLPDFDHILIDCAGSLDVITVAAMVAARGRRAQNGQSPAYVITVAAPQVKEIEGIPRLLKTIEDVAGAYNPDLELGGVVPCMVPPRSAGILYQEAVEMLHSTYGDLVTPPVRRSVTVPEAYFGRQPLLSYAPRAEVTDDYRAVFTHLRERGAL